MFRVCITLLFIQNVARTEFRERDSIKYKSSKAEKKFSKVISIIVQKIKNALTHYKAKYERLEGT